MMNQHDTEQLITIALLREWRLRNPKWEDHETCRRRYQSEITS